MPLMKLREYAIRKGVSVQAVQKAIDTGRISATSKGRIQYIDSDVADLQWEQNTRAELKEVENEIENSINVGSPKPLSYSEARTKKEQEQAEILHLKRLEIEGKLVSVEETARKWAELATKIRNKITSLPSKLKQRHPEVTLEQYSTLESIAREVLEELANDSD